MPPAPLSLCDDHTIHTPSCTHHSVFIYFWRRHEFTNSNSFGKITAEWCHKSTSDISEGTAQDRTSVCVVFIVVTRLATAAVGPCYIFRVVHIILLLNDISYCTVRIYTIQISLLLLSVGNAQNRSRRQSRRRDRASQGGYEINVLCNVNVRWQGKMVAWVSPHQSKQVVVVVYHTAAVPGVVSTCISITTAAVHTQYYYTDIFIVPSSSPSV